MSAVVIGPNDLDVDATLCDHSEADSHCTHDWRVVWGVVAKTGDGNEFAG